MKKARVFVHGILAGELIEHNENYYTFQYKNEYHGPGISLSLPIQASEYKFNKFPAFFDGLLPEGAMLESLLRKRKIDRHDYFSQLLVVGHDLVGAVTIKQESE